VKYKTGDIVIALPGCPRNCMSAGKEYEVLAAYQGSRMYHIIGDDGQPWGVDQGSFEALTFLKVAMPAMPTFSMDDVLKDWGLFATEPLELPQPRDTKDPENILGCQCGAWKVNAPGHDRWCRLYAKSAV
jgi:hypothetical protein